MILKMQFRYFRWTFSSCHYVIVFISIAIHCLFILSIGYNDGRISETKFPISTDANVIKVMFNSMTPVEPSVTLPISIEQDKVQSRFLRNTSSSQGVERKSKTVKMQENRPISTAALISMIERPEVEYFKLRELSESPVILNPTLLDDTPLILTDVPSQAAVLRFLIDEHGSIDQLKVENLPFSPSTERLIIETFSKLKFQPGKIDGQAVKSQIKIEIKVQNDGE